MRNAFSISSSVDVIKQEGVLYFSVELPKQKHQNGKTRLHFLIGYLSTCLFQSTDPLFNIVLNKYIDNFIYIYIYIYIYSLLK
jgi:hypothetical protein